MGAVDIPITELALYYGLLIIPLGAMLWLKVPMVGKTLVAVIRMTLQLAFVGLYLQVVFKINNPWLNSLWLLVMLAVADLSVIRGAGLKASRFMLPVFVALVFGTAIPLLFFVGPLLKRPGLMEAQYVIPIGGMILGNCLRADIIGIKNFYSTLQKSEKAFHLTLAQGARLSEAIMPYLREACEAALMPTVATMATIGLVSLPGMMTGVILGGTDPATAIKYQMAIMVAIFTGTAITVILAILMSLKISFTPYGVLDHTLISPSGLSTKK